MKRRLLIVEDDREIRKLLSGFLTENGYIVVMAFELYERLFGKVDLSKEQAIEMDDFLGKSKETENKDDKPN